MVRTLLAPIVALLLLSPADPDREDPPTPRGGPPDFRLASASREGRDVVVRLRQMAPVARETVNGEETFVPRNHWTGPMDLRLGEQVRAYRTDGTRVGAEEVLVALARPTGVACFVGWIGPRPADPDPFYLGLLRQGSLVLAFELPIPPP